MRYTIATLHLICGLPCSGKTTLAKELELEHRAVRLSPDEWIARIHGTDLSGQALDAARGPTEAALWDLATRLLELGVDVILENGFWSRSEREQYREQARALGVSSELHYLEATEELLMRRLIERNSKLPWGTFAIEPYDLRRWYAAFEAPTVEELRPR